MRIINRDSYKSINILRQLDTSGAALYIFWTLCAHSNMRGRSFPSFDTLERETGFSRPTVSKALKVLIEVKLVSKVEPDKRIDKEAEIPYQRNVYQIHDSIVHDGKIYPMLYAGNGGYEVEVNEINSNEVKVNEVNHYKHNISSKLNEDSNDSSAPLSEWTDTEELTLINQILDIGNQLADIELTKPQRETLMAWLIEQRDAQADFADYTGKRTQVMNNLVSKGLLLSENGQYSTRLQDIEPKSILFSLTYADLEETPPEDKKPTDKPFWEAVAAMHSWNDCNCKWQDYMKIASAKEKLELNKKIKNTCLVLDEYHEDNPFTVEEFHWIVTYWYQFKFKDRKADEKFFPVSKDAIKRNMSALRIRYKNEIIHSEASTPITESA